MLVVGIDVGGTRIKFGLIEDGQIIRSMEQGTNTFDIIRQLSNGAREIVQSSERSWEEVNGVAIGFPGMVIDSVVLDSPNISLQNCNLKEILEAELGKFVVVKNDAEMATIAEHKIGAGAGCDNMVLVTLGTGVGGGIIANKKLFVGAGGAGELGHILFERNGRPCTCGRKGCAEQYVSMKALDSLAKDIMVGYPNTCVDFNGDGLIYASELARAYKRNDACAIEIVDKFVDDLTQYLLDICNLFRPNRIVIGGGVTHAPELIDMVARNCRRLEYGYRNSPKVDILAAQLGNQAGMLGGYVCIEEELTYKDFEDTAEEQVSTEFNSQLDNISLLDSITRSLDMNNSFNSGLSSVNTIDNSDFTEESNGQYVNSVLEDISSQINTIKNEELFGAVEDTTVNDNVDYNNDNLVSVYQSNDNPVVDSSAVGMDNSDFMSAVSTISEIADIEPEVQSVPTSDVVQEDISADNTVATMEAEDDYDGEENLSLGLNDIFFGTADEHADKLEKIDLSSVSIVDNNIVENPPVVEENNENINNSGVEESAKIVEPNTNVEGPIVDNSNMYNDMQYNENAVNNTVATVVPPVDNSIFVPPVNTEPANSPVVESETVAPAEIVGNGVSIDNISNNVINDYSRLLDAMGKIDVAESQQPESPNLLSRVNKMLDDNNQ